MDKLPENHGAALDCGGASQHASEGGAGGASQHAGRASQYAKIADAWYAKVIDGASGPKRKSKRVGTNADTWGRGVQERGVPRRSILGDFSAFCNVFIAQAAHLKIIKSHSEHCCGLFSFTAAMFEKTRTTAANSGASQHAIPWKSILC